jgi:hypothetical protein
MQLSRFFSLAEMTRSDTALREGIPNEPGSAEVERLRTLCEHVLDPLRETLGQPITVNSGYRSPALNRRIGGATTSQHIEGKATDIQAPGMSVLDLFKVILRLGLPFDQVIYEARNATTKWVHVSHNPGANRGEIRVAKFGPDGRPRAYPLVTVQEALDMVERVSRSALTASKLEYIEMGDEPAPVPGATKKPRARARKAGKSGRSSGKAGSGKVRGAAATTSAARNRGAKSGARRR